MPLYTNAFPISINEKMTSQKTVYLTVNSVGLMSSAFDDSLLKGKD